MSDETKQKEKLSDLFTKNQVTLRFIAEFVKRFKDSDDDEPIKMESNVKGQETLLSDTRFCGISDKGMYTKKTVAYYDLSVIYQLCLTFKQAGINLDSVSMRTPDENFPCLFNCDRLPFEIMLAPIMVPENE